MSDMNDPAKRMKCSSGLKKRFYEAPSLKIYGSVKVLTAGGTAGDTELNPGGQCDSDPDKDSMGCP